MLTNLLLLLILFRASSEGLDGRGGVIGGGVELVILLKELRQLQY
jgi:hypothetical protein